MLLAQAAPSYTKDIIFSGVVPFVCVLLGALLSYRIQRKADDKREDESRYADCLRVMLSLSTMYSVAINLQNHINPERDAENRHLALKPFPIGFDFAEINTTDLVRIINAPEGNDLLVHLLHAQTWMKSTIETARLRNEIHLEMQRNIIQVDADHAGIPPRIDIQLRTLTDGLYEQVDSSVLKIEKAATRFGEFAAKLYPGKPVRKLEKLNASQWIEDH